MKDYQLQLAYSTARFVIPATFTLTMLKNTFLDIGPGWYAAKIDDFDEYAFLNELHLFASVQRSYFINGTTSNAPDMRLLQKTGFPDNGNV